MLLSDKRFRAAVPSLAGVLTSGEVARTASAIAMVQEPSGAIPWFAGGHTDVWDHVESAMALTAARQQTEADRAYDWLLNTQRADGSWPIRVEQGRVTDHGSDTNFCAYLATGIWHRWLVTANTVAVGRAWPSVRAALDLVVGLQHQRGEIAWAVGSEDTSLQTALLSGSSSIYLSLRCGLALADVMGEPQPDWELAVGLLGHALRVHPEAFEAKDRFSMDWYYPVLAGPLAGRRARARLDQRWGEFVVPGLGVRCVDDHPWVTGAETCELAMALDAIGERDRAVAQLASIQHLRGDDGAYWTGYVYADDTRWPVEQTTWTAAAVILAVDALSDTSGGAGIFRGDGLGPVVDVVGQHCGCRDEPGSAHRVAGLAPHPLQRSK